MKTLLVTALLAASLAIGSPAQAVPSVPQEHTYQGSPVGSLAMSPNFAGRILWGGKAYTLLLDSLGVEVWVDSAYAGVIAYPDDFVDPDVAQRLTPESVPVKTFDRLTVVFATLIPGPRALVGIVFLPEESR